MARRRECGKGGEPRMGTRWDGGDEMDVGRTAGWAQAAWIPAPRTPHGPYAARNPFSEEAPAVASPAAVVAQAVTVRAGGAGLRVQVRGGLGVRPGKGRGVESGWKGLEEARRVKAGQDVPADPSAQPQAAPQLHWRAWRRAAAPSAGDASPPADPALPRSAPPPSPRKRRGPSSPRPPPTSSTAPAALRHSAPTLANAHPVPGRLLPHCPARCRPLLQGQEDRPGARCAGEPGPIPEC